MKSVLISIRPEWVKKILSGEKTVEVRKTAPKIATPFKCYIYCTKGNLSYKTPGGMICHNNGGMVVVGEFICDRITRLFNICTDDWERLMGDTHEWHKQLVEQACLSEAELKDYAEGKACYAWHISDLKIYDKPKALSEFKQYYRKCKFEHAVRECWLCHGCQMDRPPQSWSYVEGVVENE
jgi:predicted transcriptional regulator